MKSYKFKILVLLTLGISAILPSVLAAQDQPARFHHVRLNVTNPKASVEYYQKFFSAVPVKFRDISEALLTDRSYILFNTVSKPAPINARTALWHIGWGGIDGPSEHKWRTAQGMKWETGLTPVGIPGGGHVHFMYASGPDKEIVEVWTGTPQQRYNHVHLLTQDVNATRDWYIDNLGAKGEKKHLPKPGPAPADIDFSNPASWNYVWQTQIQVDGVTFNIFGMPDAPTFWWPAEPIRKFEKTDGHVINHFAFSYPDIEPVFKRMKGDGVEIVKEIVWNDKLKMRSFFVRAPDGVLVEIVEADALPDASWLRHVDSEHQ